MPVTDIYWKRQKRLRKEYPDVYQYDSLPQGFRVQVVQMWSEDLCCITSDQHVFFRLPVQKLRREFAVFRLPPTETHDHLDYQSELCNFFLNEDNIEKALSAIELTFIAECVMHPDVPFLNKPELEQLNQAVEELNLRFKEHGIGYQFESEQIIRVDSEFTHSEIVKPCLKLLSHKRDLLKGAEDEFLTAHKHYRKRENKNAVVWCNKAFESTMKAICVDRNWMSKTKAKNAIAAELVSTCVENGLVPDYWGKKYTNGITVLLKHGVPPGRHKHGSHGQGAEITEVEDHLVFLCVEHDWRSNQISLRAGRKSILISV